MNVTPELYFNYNLWEIEVTFDDEGWDYKAVDRRGVVVPWVGVEPHDRRIRKLIWGRARNRGE